MIAFSPAVSDPASKAQQCCDNESSIKLMSRRRNSLSKLDIYDLVLRELGVEESFKLMYDV